MLQAAIRRRTANFRAGLTAGVIGSFGLKLLICRFGSQQAKQLSDITTDCGVATAENSPGENSRKTGPVFVDPLPAQRRLRYHTQHQNSLFTDKIAQIKADTKIGGGLQTSLVEASGSTRCPLQKICPYELVKCVGGVLKQAGSELQRVSDSHLRFGQIYLKHSGEFQSYQHYCSWYAKRYGDHLEAFSTSGGSSVQSFVSLLCPVGPFLTSVRQNIGHPERILAALFPASTCTPLATSAVATSGTTSSAATVSCAPLNENNYHSNNYRDNFNHARQKKNAEKAITPEKATPYWRKGESKSFFGTSRFDSPVRALSTKKTSPGKSKVDIEKASSSGSSTCLSSEVGSEKSTSPKGVIPSTRASLGSVGSLTTAEMNPASIGSNAARQALRSIPSGLGGISSRNALAQGDHRFEQKQQFIHVKSRSQICQERREESNRGRYGIRAGYAASSYQQHGLAYHYHAAGSPITAGKDAGVACAAKFLTPLPDGKFRLSLADALKQSSPTHSSSSKNETPTTLSLESILKDIESSELAAQQKPCPERPPPGLEMEVQDIEEASPLEEGSTMLSSICTRSEKKHAAAICTRVRSGKISSKVQIQNGGWTPQGADLGLLLTPGMTGLSLEAQIPLIDAKVAALQRRCEERKRLERLASTKTYPRHEMLNAMLAVKQHSDMTARRANAEDVAALLPKLSERADGMLASTRK